jgi:hypothetical protein
MTQKCLDSLFAQTKDIEFEVILVDNASTDGSSEEFSCDERITFIRSEENIGFGRANNLGYQVAKGKYLFLLNSDTILNNNAVKAFLDCAEQDNRPDVACWGTRLKTAEGNIGISYGVYPSPWYDLYIQMILFPYSKLMRKNLLDMVHLYNGSTDDGLVDYISGAALFIKKTVADKYGLFSPDYFMYCEETDMQRRYLEHGFRSRVIDGPEIVHLEGGSQRKKGRNFARALVMLKSRMIYYRRWYSSYQWRLYALILTPYKWATLHLTGADKAYRKQYFDILWNRNC